MSFRVELLGLRQYCRKIVLPVEKIKCLCEVYLLEKGISNCLDFGAGTLFWSKWFAERFNCRVVAVDLIYSTAVKKEDPNVQCFPNIDTILPDTPSFDVVFTSDVLHHLNLKEEDDFINKIAPLTKSIIIKDIDASHKIGNFLNRVHDRFFNHEKTRDINPLEIQIKLETLGFKVSYHYIPKLWYPHFLLVAIKL